LVRAPSCRSAGIDKVSGCGPEPHDDAHRRATGRTTGRAGWRRGARWRRVIVGGSLHDHEADGREREGTAGMEQAEVADFLKTIGQDMLEESPEKLDGVEMGRTWAGTAHFPVGEGNRAVRERDNAAVGDGDLEDIRGEV